MKKNIRSTLGLTAFFAFAILGISTFTEQGTTAVYASSGGSPGGHTNSPADGSSCVTCHSGTINSGTGISGIQAADLASGYVPGQTYTITLGFGEISKNKFGIEITSEKDADNSKVGTFVITDAARTLFVNANMAVSHTSAGTAAITTNATSWSVDWTAPAAGTGAVTFYAAFNAVNANGNQNGDQVYSATFPVVEKLPTQLAENVKQNTFSLYPNPMKNSFEISANEEVEKITVYDLQGKQVLNLAQGTTKVNVEHLPAGMYFVNVAIAGRISSQKIIKE
jgi:hypothetical protein